MKQWKSNLEVFHNIWIVMQRYDVDLAFSVIHVLLKWSFILNDDLPQAETLICKHKKYLQLPSNICQLILDGYHDYGMRNLQSMQKGHVSVYGE